MTVRSKLRPGKKCPLHHSKVCGCHGITFVREVIHELKYRIRSDGTKVFPDGREICPPAVLRGRKDRLIESQLNPTCGACDKCFEDYNEIELGHKISKGMNGGKRRDNWDNLFLIHSTCNREQGSMPLDLFREKKGLPPL